MPTPSFLPVDPHGIPLELQQRPQWVAWKAKWDAQRTHLKKIPVNPHTGSNARTTNPSTWGTFDLAIQRMYDDDLDGIGFVFTRDDPYVGIDLDKAVTPDGIESWAKPILDQLDTYAERSVSGTGLHLILKSDHLPDRGKRRERIEVYTQGRYFTMTGRSVEGRETIQDRSGAFPSWHEETFLETARQVPDCVMTASAPTSPGAPVLSTEDQQVVASCRKRWPKFRQLYDHADLSGYNGNHSQADQGLVNFFVKAGVTDPDRLDRLFRSSPLMRPKWDERDGYYAKRTITKALDGTVVPGVSTLGLEERLRRQNDKLSLQLTAAETRAQRNGEMLLRLSQIMGNAKLGTARCVAQALAIKFAAFESQKDVEPPYRLSDIEVGQAAGVCRQTASKHIKTLVKRNVLTRYTKWIPRHVDLLTGEIVDSRRQTFMAPVGDALDFATAVATLDLDAKWGGKRPGAFGRKNKGGDSAQLSTIRAYPNVAADAA